MQPWTSNHRDHPNTDHAKYVNKVNGEVYKQLIFIVAGMMMNDNDDDNEVLLDVKWCRQPKKKGKTLCLYGEQYWKFILRALGSRGDRYVSTLTLHQEFLQTAQYDAKKATNKWIIKNQSLTISRNKSAAAKLIMKNFINHQFLD